MHTPETEVERIHIPYPQMKKRRKQRVAAARPHGGAPHLILPVPTSKIGNRYSGRHEAPVALSLAMVHSAMAHHDDAAVFRCRRGRAIEVRAAVFTIREHHDVGAVIVGADVCPRRRAGDDAVADIVRRRTVVHAVVGPPVANHDTGAVGGRRRRVVSIPRLKAVRDVSKARSER